MRPIIKDKKAGIVNSLIMGVGALVIGVIVTLLIVDTLFGANLLTTDGRSYNATDNMIANFTTGIGNVSAKLPTILLVAAVVILFGVIVVLVRQSRQTQLGAGGGGGL